VALLAFGCLGLRVGSPSFSLMARMRARRSAGRTARVAARRNNSQKRVMVEAKRRPACKTKEY